MCITSDCADARLFRRLLAVPGDPDPASRLAGSLALLAEVTDATAAHFELTSHSPERHVAVTFPDADTAISRGVIALAHSTGRSLESASARIDARFRDVTSVHRNGIEAVICVPISTPEIEGALYLDRAITAGAFTASALEVAQWFAHQFAQVADRLVPPPPRSLHDETRRFQQRRVRAALERSNWNVASAARELSVTRNFVYSLSPEARRRRR
jgi:Nif-specific regulatory protein